MSELEVLGTEVSPSNVVNVSDQAPIPPVETASFPSRTSKLSEVDRMALELAKSQKQLVLAEAKTALANHEKSELQYKYVVLQIYMKYGLTEADALNESGDIIYGGANVAK